MKQLASIVKNAHGEITCTITMDEGDPMFEFFRITNGKIVRQLGHIIRNETELLD